ncbi:MAG: hypothetical protein ACK4GT_03670 [Pararhodobacter sp.]
MAEPESDRLYLDPDAWTDAPQVAIDSLLARVGGGLVIDASGAGVIPAQLAQLLVAARRSARAQGQGFRLDSPSDAARQSLTAIGLADLLDEVPA